MSEENTSIASGAELSADTWADFVTRLRHDCVGKGVEDHCTADAIFVVQARRLIYGIDPDYTEKLCVIVSCDETEWFSPQEYWDDLDEDGKERLDEAVLSETDCRFLELSETDKWDFLGDLDEHVVTGWDDRWEYVNAHFTSDAAEAFIKRKKHDYPDGLRVYVDAQIYCWEFNTIKAAILSGRLRLTQ